MKLGQSERIVVSACIHRAESVATLVTKGVTVDDFAVKASRMVLEVVLDLHKQGLHGPEVVKTALEQRGVMDKLGQDRWLDLISDGWMDSQDPFLYHLKAVQKASYLRRASEAMESGLLESDSGTMEERIEAVDEAVKRLQSIRIIDRQDVFTAADLQDAAISALVNQDEPVIRRRTGIPDIDRLTGGMISNRVNILAGATNHGKSMTGDQILLNNALEFHRQGADEVCVKFDPENDAQTNRIRLISNLTATLNPDGVGVEKLAGHVQGLSKLGSFELELAKEATHLLGKLNILLDCSGRPTPEYIRSRLLAASATRPIGLVNFDYLEMVGSQSALPKNQRIEEGALALHEVTREFNTPMLVMAQTSEGATNREDGIPTLSDIAWSQFVKRVAPWVAMVHSPWEHWLQSGCRGDEPDMADYWIYIRKNKGRTGQAQMRHNRECLRVFTDARDYGGL